MGFFKILGGIALGIGAVAAAPFTGGGSLLAGASLAASLAGAATVATAVGAGAVGAVVGAAMSDSDREKGRREGERTATAKYQLKMDQLLGEFERAKRTMTDDKAYYELLVAMYAVGIATAKADGVISEEELADLEQLTAGIATSNLPSHVKDSFNLLRANPPNFNTAMEYVKKLNGVNIKLFENVIEVISYSDGVQTPQEIALLEAFRRAAA